jgi:thiamine biosynthesis lipoprotein
MFRHAFAAMGTEVELLLDADDPAGLAEAEREFRRLESLLSRFRPDSQLSRLNEAGELVVGPELLELTECAVEARERTDGRFDPTVHDAVVAAGYDRSIELVAPAAPAAGPGTARTGGHVEIDRERGRVALEPGYRLDLGGIAKGWAADRVAAQLGTTSSALVNAGGDIAAAGSREWPVAVEVAADTVTLGVVEGGLATTGRDRRRWTRDGRAQHHIVDPSTGMPAVTDLVAVTVAAACARDAEVLATSLFLAGGCERALGEADAAGIPAVFVTSNGAALLSEALA